MVERESAILLIQHEVTDGYGVWWIKRQLRDPLRREEDHGDIFIGPEPTVAMKQ